MSHKVSTSPVDYIVPLNINKLEGRMMYVPAPEGKRRNILFVYGQHAKLERWWSLAEILNDYGSVTVPDLPGFGGMDSFYRIGRRPDIDAYADYLAAFIKLRFKRKRITIVGLAFGFVAATRMLQRYPELSKKVDVLISLAGLMHRDDFAYTPAQRRLYSSTTRFLAVRPVSFIVRYGFLNPLSLRLLHSSLPNSRLRTLNLKPKEFKAAADYDIELWQANDARTHWLTTSEMLQLDNCTKRVELTVIHVVPKSDPYLLDDIVSEHMKIVFRDYRHYSSNSTGRVPILMSDKKAVAGLLPTSLRRMLSSNP